MNNDQKDIRWKQRFQNFEKTLHLLESAISIEKPDIVQKAGLIQFFEMTFELSWNLMKDYLEEQGFVDINSPRAAIKKAFEVNLITEGQFWLQLLNDRNITSHVYDEQTATEITSLIKNNYFPLLKGLYSTFKKLSN